MDRLDRRPREHQPTTPQRAPLTAAAKRSQRLRQRRKTGIRCLVIEISEPDLQCLVKVAPQADPAVERTIRAVLSALSRNTGDQAHRATEQSGQVPREYEACAHCGNAGRVGYGPGDLLPAEIRGEHFVVHSRCFEALAAARNRS